MEAEAVLSDADRAVWQSLRTGEAQFTGPGQQYEDDITIAEQDFQQVAALEPRGGAASGVLQTLTGQLVTYQGLVEQADAANRADTALGPASSHDLGYAISGTEAPSLSAAAVLSSAYESAISPPNIAAGRRAHRLPDSRSCRTKDRPSATRMGSTDPPLSQPHDTRPDESPRMLGESASRNRGVTAPHAGLGALTDPFSPDLRARGGQAYRRRGPRAGGMGPGVTAVAPPAARGDAAGCSPIQPDPVWHPCHRTMKMRRIPTSG